MELVGFVLVVGFLVLVAYGAKAAYQGDDEDEGVDWGAEHQARTAPRPPRDPRPAPQAGDDVPPDLRDLGRTRGQDDVPPDLRDLGRTRGGEAAPVRGRGGDGLLDDVPDYLREPGASGGAGSGQGVPDEAPPTRGSRPVGEVEEQDVPGRDVPEQAAAGRASGERDVVGGDSAAVDGPPADAERPAAGADQALAGPGGPTEQVGDEEHAAVTPPGVTTWICVRADGTGPVVSALALRDVRSVTWGEATTAALEAPVGALRGRRPLAVTPAPGGWVVVAGRLLGRGTSDDVGWLSQVLGEAHLFADDTGGVEVWERWEDGRPVRRHRRVPGEKPVDVGDAQDDGGSTAADVATAWSLAAAVVPAHAPALLGTG